MRRQEVINQQLLPSTASLAIWGAAAVLMGCFLALAGVAGVLVVLAINILILTGGIAAKFPASVMGVIVCCLALVPFNWGLKAGAGPELYGDEVLPVFCLVAIPALYMFTRRSWRPGFGGVYWALVTLVVLQSLSFVSVSDSVAYRNFFDAYVLGALLLVLFLQEGANSSPEAVGTFVTAVTIAVAALSIAERVLLRNPVLEHELQYVSPDLARLTSGVYRPYVTFFHPSEAGTFMALGVPFAVRQFIRRKSWLSLLGFVILVAGLIVNATRGVWVGVLFAGFLEMRYVWTLLFAAFPVAALCGWITYIALKATPFMQRLTDPNDLLVRFESWKLIGRMFADHPLIGVGHMQYTKVYLNYVQNVSDVARFNVFSVGVADNIFLTTLADHGLLGLVGLVVFLMVAYAHLRRFRLKLFRHGLVTQATFVRCSELSLVIYVVCGCLADVQLFTKASRLMFILVGLGLAQGVRAIAFSHGAEVSTYAALSAREHQEK